MNLKIITAAITAAVLAFGMTACNRNAGTGSSADQYSKQRSGSAAGGSTAPSSPSSPSSPSGSTGSSPSEASPGGSGSGSGAGTGTGNTGASGSSK